MGPTTSLSKAFTGPHPKGPEEVPLRAETTRKRLTDVFDLSARRICQEFHCKGKDETRADLGGLFMDHNPQTEMLFVHAEEYREAT